MKRSLAVPVASLALALALVGCSGSDDDDEPAPPAPSGTTTAPVDTEQAELDDEVITDTTQPTKDEFLEEANAICAAGNAKVAAAAERVDEADTAAFEAFVTDTLVPTVRDQVISVRLIGLPEAEAAEISIILDETDLVIDRVEADPSLLAGDGDPFAEVDQRLTDYGLTECASA